MVWVTYLEDKDVVKENFRRLIEEGVYERELYSDLLNGKMGQGA